MDSEQLDVQIKRLLLFSKIASDSGNGHLANATKENFIHNTFPHHQVHIFDWCYLPPFDVFSNILECFGEPQHELTYCDTDFPTRNVCAMFNNRFVFLYELTSSSVPRGYNISFAEESDYLIYKMKFE